MAYNENPSYATGGAITATQYDVLVGGSSNSIVSVGPGSAGQVLQSAGNAANPAYSTATYPTIGTSTGSILRADGTNWAATTSTYPTTNAISTLLYASSANVMGALATANSAILATNSSGVPSITTASGNWLNTSRSAFCAYNSSAHTNVTGDGTTYNVVFDTELFDQGSNFASNTFTAPVTGKYFFSCSILCQQVVTNMDVTITLVATGQSYFRGNTQGTGATGNYQISNTWFISMASGDTATITLVLSGGAKVVDIFGVASDPRTCFCGYLVC